jgi:hypothetical protein
MIQHMKLNGSVKFGQYKAISCTVQLKIDIHEEDEWAEPDPHYNPSDYIDGVRVTGELFFDSSPLNDPREKHPIKPNAVGELTVRDGDESSKLNIVVIERTGDSDVVPRKIKRYFWLFFVVGKPIRDALGIFPRDYRGVNMNRVYACTNFRGYWSTAVSSVVVASDRREAAQILKNKLQEAGIHFDEGVDLTFTEINIMNKGAVILNDGN